VNRDFRPTFFLAAAVITGVAALAPPFDRLADASFAWHMLQHLILIYVVALLVVAARPLDFYAKFARKRATEAFVRATRPLHVLASPAIALAFFVATLWGTHFSALYELALEHPWVHAGEHLLYLAAGVVFWLPVIAPPPLRAASYPVRAFYLALALPQGALVAMVIESARSPLYPRYAAAAGSVAVALADQRNAAAVMWIAGGLTIFAAFLLTIAAWARREVATES
jgi:putative membrane protein